MSAVAGIVYFDERPLEPTLLPAMLATMAKRGPDGSAHWQQGSAALGHCKLVTTPEAREEQQPLCSTDANTVLVFSGRLDNRAELQRALRSRGAQLRNNTDAELVLHAWLLWGNESPSKVIGDFVFAVWDCRAQQLFLARDVSGARHLYYAQGQNWFAFASELRALLPLKALSRELNQYRLWDYMIASTDRIDETGTFLQQVQRLPLAHALQVSAAGSRSWRYWFPEQLAPVRYASMADCCAAFVETLVTATRARLRSNGPVGAMLSGGMDSSSIVALIGKYCRDDLTLPLHTFSLVNAERAACLDWPYIQAMLQDKQLVPTVLDSVLPDAQLAKVFAKLSAADSPYHAADGLTNAVMAEAAQAQQVRSLLDGGAGDHLFLSPETSLEVVFNKQRWGSFLPVWQGYRRHHITGFWPAVLRKLLRAAAPESLVERYRQQYQQQHWLAALQQDQVLHALPRATAQAYWQQRQALQQGRVAAMAVSRTECPQLGDLLSPMFGFAYEMGESLFGAYQVEQRGPYSDRRVMEFAFTMPIEAKLARGWYKSFLRESMRGILPEAVRTRTVVGGHPGHAFQSRYLAFAKQQRPQWFAQGAQLATVVQTLGLPADALTQLAGNDELLFRLAALQEWLASLK